MRAGSSLTCEVVSVSCGDGAPELPKRHYKTWVMRNIANSNSPCECYQSLLERSESDVTVFIHDDVKIFDESWPEAVLTLLSQDEVVAVGLGGARGLGNKDLYRKPFDIRNMARVDYASNQEDAETHGKRFNGVRQVAVVDAFFMAVRTEWLRSRGGWPVKHLTHHCLDLWLACEATRAGKEIWMAGVSCLHRGGGTSVGESYARAKWLQGGTLERDHLLPHIWLFNEYRDVLPIL